MNTLNKVDSFQNRLNAVMKEKKINQTRLSKMTQIPRSSFAYYCTGVYEPNAEKILILALSLNVNPYWLLGYNVSKNNTMFNEITNILMTKNETDLKKAKNLLLVLFSGN